MSESPSNQTRLDELADSFVNRDRKGPVHQANFSELGRILEFSCPDPDEGRGYYLEKGIPVHRPVCQLWGIGSRPRIGLSSHDLADNENTRTQTM